MSIRVWNTLKSGAFSDGKRFLSTKLQESVSEAKHFGLKQKFHRPERRKIGLRPRDYIVFGAKTGV